VPVSYAYAARSVYGHCADGRKLTAMRRDPQVCFEVEDVRGLAEWTSVVATGRFEELHGEQAQMALDLLRERFARMSRWRPSTGTGPAIRPCCSASACCRGRGASNARAPSIPPLRRPTGWAPRQITTPMARLMGASGSSSR
jgi:nitroimidazol reductase NimA-like FMN-containing flavoprotein (pyridoxamine 5'-phosphate oxidase superfamily)